MNQQAELFQVENVQSIQRFTPSVPGSGVKAKQTLVDDVCKSRHKGNKYSAAANPTESIKSKQLCVVLAAIKKLGKASSEMVEDLTGMSHQSCSARFSDAKRLGLIHRVGETVTKSASLCGLFEAVN
jgi:hypothetical protein